MRLLFAILVLVFSASASATVDPAVVHANSIKSGAIGYEEGWFGSGDTKLHYVEAGRGPLIILYHGFPSFWYSWFDQMEILKTGYRVVAVDGLGAGLSAKPEVLAPYRIAALAAQLDALARHLGGEQRFVLVGHDWGAALAFAYAQAYPKRLHAVIGLSAPPYNLFLDLARGDAEQQARSQYMQLFRTLTLADIKTRGVGPQLWKQSYSALQLKGSLSAAESELFRVALSDPHAINGGMNWYRANIPPFAQIGDGQFWPSRDTRISVPALLIWGDADRTFVRDFIERMRATTPSLDVTILSGVGHWTPMEDPVAANAAIQRFLARHRPSRSR